MKINQNLETLTIRVIRITILFVLIVLPASVAWGHGPKGHGDTSFTAFEAAKKGIQLYDRLLTA